ncbi:Diacylglycerol O-acyltransferase 2 [Acorus calamus]|uniref:Diacylglycerol O-acyltransferase 2 n=1 Tax=Acorus calamus TaxID=4465 RepID=A0AAV9DQ76_ACOCL|nr:Diacylglycerol O-acyltransferase 2 [Acorus calamus]
MSRDNLPTFPSFYSVLLCQCIHHRDLLHGRALFRQCIIHRRGCGGGCGDGCIGGGGGGKIVAEHAVDDDEGFVEAGGGVILVDDKSRFGQALASNVGKYAPGYFPITVYIEDVKALDPNKSYVLAAEPHSVFPMGCLSLMSITGFLPLSKTKALASSAVAFLKKRYGFVRVAIQTGSPIVPVFCFGQVVELHAQYVSALEKLFLKYRKVSGFADMELSII